MRTEPAVRGGILHLDGEPVFLLSGDYPYYRDHVENWHPRLQDIRDTGIRFLTAYVPWRHHAPKDPLKGNEGYDFDGRTQPNRDVKGFLRLCQKVGLHVILKPGPFIHAELRYGGLPDYVDSASNPEIEGERTGSGEVYAWSEGPLARPLPAPLDPVYTEYVRDWLSAVTENVLTPFLATEGGPVVAIQLLNEGIYSDSANGIITNSGYSRSSRGVWSRFLQWKYRSLGRYNSLHGTSWREWTEIPIPGSVSPSKHPYGMLTYLDRSECAHHLYEEVIRRYRGYLLDAGLDPRIPILVNYNPNGNGYRTHVGSNDGWYSKVAWHPRQGVYWGYTDWIGVVEREPRAYLQYVLAGTRERGPNLEENWGFSGHYAPAFAWTQPSYFQSLLLVAAGATGFNVYTMVGTSAWFEDENLRSPRSPPFAALQPPGRENIYPTHAPIGSDGERLPKWSTLRQLADHLTAEGASLVGDRLVDIAWAVYPPYAWAGAWAPSGEGDERPWEEAGLRACPRVAYHGLEAAIEDSIETGMDMGQVDVRSSDLEALGRHPLIVLAGYDYMDKETQSKIVGYVEAGGALLMTGLLPRLDEFLRPSDDCLLRERLFPHRAERFEKLPQGQTRSVSLGEMARLGTAAGWIVHVNPPKDAEAIASLPDGSPVGYVRRAGQGIAAYLGFRPWYAVANGDDLRLVSANRGLIARFAERFTRATVTYANSTRCAACGMASVSDVNVWQYRAPQRPEVDHVLVVNRAPTPHMAEIEFTRQDGSKPQFRIALVPQTVCLVTFEAGHARSFLLKCVNDHNSVAVPPFLEEPAGGVWAADAPCDLCVTRDGANTLRVSVGNAQNRETRVILPIKHHEVNHVESELGDATAPQKARDGVSLRLRDLNEAGAYKIQLEEI